jgi:hypothetical protein
LSDRFTGEFRLEGAGYQHVETGISGLAGSGDKIGALDRTEFGTYENGGALLGFTLQIAPLGANEVTGFKAQIKSRA